MRDNRLPCHGRQLDKSGMSAKHPEILLGSAYACMQRMPSHATVSASIQLLTVPQSPGSLAGLMQRRRFAPLPLLAVMECHPLRVLNKLSVVARCTVHELRSHVPH